MSVTKFASLPPNFAGAMINIFSLGPMLNITPIWCLPLQHLLLVLTNQKEGRRATPSASVKLLGYRLKPMTIFEKMHEKEIKILSALLLIADF